LFVKAKVFTKVVKKGYAFFTYILSSPNIEPCPHEIPFQYQKFKDVFEKKNVDTLSKTSIIQLDH